MGQPQYLAGLRRPMEPCLPLTPMARVSLTFIPSTGRMVQNHLPVCCYRAAPCMAQRPEGAVRGVARWTEARYSPLTSMDWALQPCIVSRQSTLFPHLILTSMEPIRLV